MYFHCKWKNSSLSFVGDKNLKKLLFYFLFSNCNVCLSWQFMALLSEFTKSYNRVELLLLVYQKHTIVGKCTVFVRKNHACKHFIWEVFELIFKSLMFDWRRLIGNLANPSILWDIISSETLKDTCVRLLRCFSLKKHLSPFLVLCSEHENQNTTDIRVGPWPLEG